MAADTQVNYGAMTFPSRKIFATVQGLVGVAGPSIQCAKFIEWVEEGMDKNTRPDMEEGDEIQALLLNDEGLFFFEGDWVACRVERDYHAIGTGGEAALAAMMCGKNPREAVEVACCIDSQSGQPVTVLNL